jgi:hypothetical protein
MPRPMTIKGAPAWGRHADAPPSGCLDDLAGRIGPELPAIREALGTEVEVAAAFARDPRGHEVLLVATRSGLRVWRIHREGDPCPEIMTWPRVRVSPVRRDPARDHRTPHPEEATHSCDVRVDGLTFVVAAEGPSGLGAVSAFHDEVVRRGTPWHYPG